MNDNDFIKALDVCLIEDCDECPLRGFSNCRNSLAVGISEVINRQKAEIERMQREQDRFADIGKMYSEIRAEAIKEFAGRMMKCIVRYAVYDEGGWDSKEEAVRIEDVASLVREMTEGT